MIVTLSLFIYSTVLQFCFTYLRVSVGGRGLVLLWLFGDTVKWGSDCWVESGSGSGSVLCVGSVWADPPVPGCDFVVFLCCFLSLVRTPTGGTLAPGGGGENFQDHPLRRHWRLTIRYRSGRKRWGVAIVGPVRIRG